MKVLVSICMALFLAGCASLSYQTADGTKVRYTRLFAAADTIKGEVGPAKIEANGQKIDAATLTAILTAVGGLK